MNFYEVPEFSESNMLTLTLKANGTEHVCDVKNGPAYEDVHKTKKATRQRQTHREKPQGNSTILLTVNAMLAI